MSKKKKDVLIIEDENPLRHALVKTFLDNDYIVAEADNAEYALVQLEKIEPDIILLDLRLPGMNGMTFMNELEKRNKDIPTIILTNDDSHMTQMRGMMKGARDYLIKANTSLETIVSLVQKRLA